MGLTAMMTFALLIIGAYFAWLSVRALRTGEVTLSVGRKRTFSRSSDGSYWIVLCWYLAIAAFALGSAFSTV